MISTDIKFYHSGGIANNNPEADLGDAISLFEINNILFDDLTAQESRIGLTDYRCFYIKNTNLTETARNLEFKILSQRASGSDIIVGLDLSDEIQEIEFVGTPNEDETVELQINGTNFIVEYNINTTIWKKNFQQSLRVINNFQDSIIEVSGEVPNVIFTINFLGQAAKKKYSLISVIANNLTDTVINISEIQEGSPINTTAPTISSKLHTPVDVDFKLGPFILGDLNPDDSFPVWAKRITPPNTIKKTNDNFIIELEFAG